MGGTNDKGMHLCDFKTAVIFFLKNYYYFFFTFICVWEGKEGTQLQREVLGPGSQLSESKRRRLAHGFQFISSRKALENKKRFA